RFLRLHAPRPTQIYPLSLHDALPIYRVRPRERLLPYLGELAARHAFLALVPVCALKADNIEALRDAIAAHLPLSPALFPDGELTDRKSTRLNSSHLGISYAVFCLKKK